jgi:Fe-Mn family superoxide dismutase
VLHEHYFANLGGDGKASGPIVERIKQSFGSYDTWETEFRRTAGALAGGSGWVVLALNLHDGELHNYWAWDHAHNAVLGAPLLVLDMYEHAYHMDFGAAAARYIDAFMANVKWEEVGRRDEWARKAARP